MDAGLTLVLIGGAITLGLALYVLYAAVDQALTGRTRLLPMPRLTPRRKAFHRSGLDRRRNPAKIEFPATINGKLVHEDRRKGERRRRSR